MKKITAIIITIIIACACALPGYERIGDTDMWIIDCTDKDGRVWSFYGEEEDAHIGIMFNLLMWNMGEAEEDDEIIEVYYEGRMDDHALMAWLTGSWQ